MLLAADNFRGLIGTLNVSRGSEPVEEGRAMVVRHSLTAQSRFRAGNVGEEEENQIEGESKKR